MNKLAIVVPAVAMTIACSSNVSLQPGQWEMVPKVTSLEIAGVPAETAEQLKQSTASEMPPFPTCLDPATVADPADWVARDGAGGFGVVRFSAEPPGPGSSEQRCNFTTRTFENGRIDMAATCPTASGQEQYTYTGTYTATTLDMRISTEAQAATQPTVRTTVAVTGRRTGECSR